MSAARHGARASALSLPLREGCGPTLGALALARWRRCGRRARALALAALALCCVFLGVALVTLGGGRISYAAGPIPFSFSAAGLRRIAPEAGGEVRVARYAHGALEGSFAVSSLALPPYSGSVTGVLPLAAVRYVEKVLAPRSGGFSLVGEGPVRKDAYGAWEELPPTTIYYHVSTYAIAFIARLAGDPLYGRVIWLIPGSGHPRSALLLTLLERVRPGHFSATAALSLGTTGALSGPLRSFAIG